MTIVGIDQDESDDNRDVEKQMNLGQTKQVKRVEFDD